MVEGLEPRVRTPMRDNAHTLSDFASLPSRSSASPAAGAAARNIAKLMEKYGDGFMTLMAVLLERKRQAGSE
jgi:hypothetical protein